MVVAVLSQYNVVAKKVSLSGPTSFAPLIRKTIEHVIQSGNKVKSVVYTARELCVVRHNIR
jgi:hypothetical protein